MIVAVVDTHAALWYVFANPQLSSQARVTIDEAASNGNQIGLSSISLVEVIYLSEKARVPGHSLDHVLAYVDRVDAIFVVLPFGRPQALTMLDIPRSIVPDMPDRIIAATAKFYGVPLITRDRQIRQANIETIW